MGLRITVQSLWPETRASTFVYDFMQSRIVIGRSRSADVQLPHTAVSGTHATIHERGAGYVIVDEGSTNGTRVDEALLVPGRPKSLRAHEVVDLGGFRLTIEVGVPVARTISARLSYDFAREMLAEQLGSKEAPGLDAQLAAIQSGTDEPIELLPIATQRQPEPAPSRASRPSDPRASHPEARSVAATPSKLGRGALAVYALAALVVATSIAVMAMLMHP